MCNVARNAVHAHDGRVAIEIRPRAPMGNRDPLGTSRVPHTTPRWAWSCGWETACTPRRWPCCRSGALLRGRRSSLEGRSSAHRCVRGRCRLTLRDVEHAAPDEMLDVLVLGNAMSNQWSRKGGDVHTLQTSAIFFPCAIPLLPSKYSQKLVTANTP